MSRDSGLWTQDPVLTVWRADGTVQQRTNLAERGWHEIDFTVYDHRTAEVVHHETVSGIPHALTNLVRGAMLDGRGAGLGMWPTPPCSEYFVLVRTVWSEGAEGHFTLVQQCLEIGPKYGRKVMRHKHDIPRMLWDKDWVWTGSVTP